MNANARLARGDFPDFNDSNRLGKGQATPERLTTLVNIFASPRLDISQDRAEPELAAVLGAWRLVVQINTTASLQHPNILRLFDSGTADRFLCRVMPFVEGETLRETLRETLTGETRLGVDEAVRLCREAAGALHQAPRVNRSVPSWRPGFRGGTIK